MLTLVPPYGSVEYKNLITKEGVFMTNEKIHELYYGLGRFSNIGNTKFAYFILKNKRLCEQEVKHMEEARKLDPKFTEFEKERIELAKTHAEKDEQGNPVMVTDEAKRQHYKVTDIAKFEEAFKALGEKYKETIELQKKNEEEFAALLDSESKLVLHTVKQSDLPETLTVKDLELLEGLIVE